MTASEMQAITVLSDMVKQNAITAQRDHDDTVKLLMETESRLIMKIDEKDMAIASIVEHCAVRKREVDAVLAREMVSTDAHIAAAKIEAVAESKPKPSIYFLATKGAFEGLFRFTSRAAVLATLVAGVVTLLDKLHVF